MSEAQNVPTANTQAVPIQITATHTRSDNEQFGQTHLFILLSDGRIYQLAQRGHNPDEWSEIKGPWMEER